MHGQLAGRWDGWTRTDGRSVRAGTENGGQGGSNTAARPADEAANKAAAQEFAKAFATGSEKSLTALFTDEAEYVDENREAVRGREALAKAYAAFFAKRKQVAAESKTEAIRFLVPTRPWKKRVHRERNGRPADGESLQRALRSSERQMVDRALEGMERPGYERSQTRTTLPG